MRFALIAMILVLGGCGKKIHTVYIQPDYNELKWKTESFTVTSGATVKIVMDNIASGISNVMSHNVVVLDKRDTAEAREALIQDVGRAATEAGEEREFFPDHPGILLRTPLAGPGLKTEVVFTAPTPGDYPYICTFAGHWQTMRGIMHVTTK